METARGLKKALTGSEFVRCHADFIQGGPCRHKKRHLIVDRGEKPLSVLQTSVHDRDNKFFKIDAVIQREIGIQIGKQSCGHSFINIGNIHTCEEQKVRSPACRDFRADMRLKFVFAHGFVFHLNAGVEFLEKPDRGRHDGFAHGSVRIYNQISGFFGHFKPRIIRLSLRYVRGRSRRRIITRVVLQRLCVAAAARKSGQ